MNEDLEALRPDLLKRARLQLAGTRLRDADENDLVQEVFTAILEARLEGTVILNLRAYAFLTLRHNFLDRVGLHYHRREQLSPDGDSQQNNDTLDPASLHDISDLHVRDACRGLAPGERRFLELHVLEGHTVVAAQRLAGWPPKAAHFWMKKLLESVANAIGQTKRSEL